MSRTMLTRAAGVAFVAGSLLLTGCGASGGSGTGTLAGGTKSQKVEAGSFEGAKGASFLKQVASATSEVKTMREHMTMSSKGSGLDLSMTADGEFDAANRRGHFTMSIPEMGGEIEMVLDGDTVYMKIPMLASGDKPWSKVSLDDLSKAGGTSGTGAVGDPGAFLKMLEGTGADITTIGKEDVRGVSTTHISTSLDLAKLLKDAVGAEKADLQKQLDSLGGAALPAVPTEVWVDDDGYVRKLTMDMDLSKTAGVSGSVAITVELYDFNEPVKVEVPDPSQVDDFGAGLFGGN